MIWLAICHHWIGQWFMACSATNYMYFDDKGWLCNSPVSQWFFPWRWAARTTCISSNVMTTNFRLYNNISQILLLYKTWGYHNKFYSTKSLGVNQWYVKIPQCRYMEHGFKNVAFYVQKLIALWAICWNLPLFHNTPLGAPAFVILIYYAYMRYQVIPLYQHLLRHRSNTCHEDFCAKSRCLGYG